MKLNTKIKLPEKTPLGSIEFESKMNSSKDLRKAGFVPCDGRIIKRGDFKGKKVPELGKGFWAKVYDFEKKE